MRRSEIAKEASVFTDRLRAIFKGIIQPIAAFLLRMGLTPNGVSLLGLFGHLIAAVLIAFNQLTWAGILLLLFAPLDALDGTMARMRSEHSPFGAFLDSVVDRYAEWVIFGGLIFYFSSKGDELGTLLVYIAMGGSIMVSYTRARAESLGLDAKIGFLSRVERYIVIIPMLILAKPMIGLWILAFFTNFTSLQRIFHVRSQVRKQQST